MTNMRPVITAVVRQVVTTRENTGERLMKAQALFRLQQSCNSNTVAFSFVFDKFYLIMD
jgi:hypothetical protein